VLGARAGLPRALALDGRPVAVGALTADLPEELEDAIKDLIIRERTTEGYEDEVRMLLLQKEEFRKGAAEATAAARIELDALETEQRRLVEFITKAVSRGLDHEPFLEKLDVLQQRIRAAQGEVAGDGRLSVGSCDVIALALVLTAPPAGAAKRHSARLDGGGLRVAPRDGMRVTAWRCARRIRTVKAREAVAGAPGTCAEPGGVRCAIANRRARRKEV
jgi:hypothetical protein